MSHSATLPFAVKGAQVRPPGTNATELAKIRKAIVGIFDLVPHHSVLSVLDEIMRDRVRQEFDQLTSQPEWLRRQLELEGDILTLRLVKDNRDYVGTATFVSGRFTIPRSSLHRDKDAGKVIAFRPSKDADFIFPFEQFVDGEVLAWAAAIVKAVGNGAPALHFLYVPRKSLGDQSFADALRDPRDRDVPALIQKAITRLVAE